ncbi:RibD family protein [Salinicola rhizosphaerae]|uniref:Bacterial bifunctional deaminase-reductase C-terminal domain-containing protein n=1 Tax=Salinicola rhizosphaerae TaxID=1443141 RepID=A0ABQ3E1Y6_9GAMM|nr:RibD family protein [Salinicola rhizosphaerae]GHB23748.1 hypothetical protein GCM10009038_23360 [Salinicola rhizosphaerae]
MTLSAPSSRIHTDQAWNWIRRIADLASSSAFDGRLEEVSGDDAVWLDVDADGEWSCSHELDPEAAALLTVWLPWCVFALNEGPCVIAQIGQSLDGRIATVSGASHYVTGQASLVHLHRLRALVDAVVVGAGTVDADDPQLTVRHVSGNNPLRVVLDPRGRVAACRRVFTDAVAPTWHLLNDGVEVGGVAEHVEIHRLTPAAQGVAPADVIAMLAEAGYRRILIEGGGLTISRFLQAGCLDRLHSVVAPMLIGSGRPAITLPEIDTLDQALRPACRHFTLGNDVLFDFDLRREAGRSI